MRNGNKSVSIFDTWQIACSYRTYEEWKLNYTAWSHHFQSFVLTVPMRNGNPRNVSLLNLNNPFLPYLWGMETHPWSIVTVRREGSYRTYEEWKQWWQDCCSRESQRSYRTYEEWKRGRFVSAYQPIWRVLTVPMRNGNSFSCSFWIQYFRFLPYLWGMETS